MKLAPPIAKQGVRVARKGLQGARGYANEVRNTRIQITYARALRTLEFPDKRGSQKLAVIIHLYYVDNWPLFKQKLTNLSGLSFDLFLTIPKENEAFMSDVKRDFPKARYIIVPNRGRDVLPFIMIAKALLAEGYEYVLKFHSKKSTHWGGGQSWLEATMNQLLPSDPKKVVGIIKKLENPSTGIIGPSDYYYPLTINFEANGVHMTKVLQRLYGKNAAWGCLQKNRQEYGFFGGTMFWARLDALQPLLERPGVARFEKENGQIDGTYAHALERLFCIVPELDGKNMYELKPSGVRARAYKSDNIPEWSEHHGKESRDAMRSDD
jgi:lipopolysaccharide biosynthesis protein